MGDLGKLKEAALEAVAREFLATWKMDSGLLTASTTIAGKRVVLEFVAVKDPSPGDRAKTHLRFDKAAAG